MSCHYVICSLALRSSYFHEHTGNQDRAGDSANGVRTDRPEEHDPLRLHYYPVSIPRCTPSTKCTLCPPCLVLLFHSISLALALSSLVTTNSYIQLERYPVCGAYHKHGLTYHRAFLLTYYPPKISFVSHISKTCFTRISSSLLRRSPPALVPSHLPRSEPCLSTITIKRYEA